jgi:hypothetical protein
VFFRCKFFICLLANEYNNKLEYSGPLVGTTRGKGFQLPSGLCSKPSFSPKNGCEGWGYAMVWEWRLGREDGGSLELQCMPFARKQVVRWKRREERVELRVCDKHSMLLQDCSPSSCWAVFIHKPCCRLNVCVLSEFIFEALIPQIMGFGGKNSREK